MPRIIFSIVLLFMVGFAHASAEGKVKKIVLLYNATSDSTSTSSSIDGHIKRGFDLAIERLPASKYQFVWIDTGESAESTLSAFEQIKSNPPDLIVGPSHSFQVAMLLHLMKEAKMNVPLITPTATSTELLDYPNIFMMSNSNRIQAKILSKSLKNKKVKKVLIVRLRDCAYCNNFADELKTSLKGIATSEISIFEREIDTSKALAESCGCDDIVIPALEIETARVIERLYPKNTRATFWSGDGVGTLARFVADLNLEGLKFKWITHYSPKISVPANKTFEAAFKKAYHTDPIDTSAFYYEALMFGVSRFFLHNNSPNYASLTGPAKIEKRQVSRPMALMGIDHRDSKFLGLTGVGN